MKRTLADTIITINGRFSYHVEFTMTKDEEIVLRIMEYGFHHAMLTGDSHILRFPEPQIVYLYNVEKLPDEYLLTVRFGEQGDFTYKIPVYKYLQKPMKELNQKKMIVLIPFQLLRMREKIENERTPENIEALKKLISHDILDALEQNVKVGNITGIEALKLQRMIQQLYHHIYDKYDELKEGGVDQMVEEPLIFDVDILEDKLEKTENKLRLSEADNRALVRANQVWKLLARGFSETEVMQKTGLSAKELKEIMESE